MLKFRMLILLSCILLLAFPVFAQEPRPTVSLGDSGMGQVLVGPNGMTLYTFSRDTLDTSNCYEACAETWPPLLVGNVDNLTVGDGLPGEVGTIERTTGTTQVTYNGMPLYYWYLDTAAGDTRGNAVGNVWWAIPPATVYISNDDTLGDILVGPTGATLYMFTHDEVGVSNCSGDCLTNWPPLLVEDEDEVVAGAILPGTLGTIEREDDTYQVTYNGWPLYYWKDDAARGDTTGEAVGDSWYTVVPEVVTVGHDDTLGDFLIARNGRTLYQYSEDTAGVSTCTDDCAQTWRPYTLPANDRLAAGDGIAGELGTIEGPNGSLIVTYNGLPLYYNRGDRATGDTTGQGVENEWAVVAP